ncbi:MAG: SpoIIE family protein phosphatase [Methanoregula sp.]|nr:SpoIIE family protein phosphatase [Methanoregula sp.]
MSVRQKILVIFLSLSLISLLITGVVAFFTINDVGNYAKQSSRTLGMTAVNDSTDSLQRESVINLLQIATDHAEITNVIFADTDSEMEILAALAVSLQRNAPLIPQVPSYSRIAPPPDPYDGTFAFIAPNSMITQESEEYQTLEGMDDLLKAVYIADSDIITIYVATDSGIMRRYPYDNTTPPEYDPRVRPWFDNAKKSSTVFWGEPYPDKARNGMIVTNSRSVQTKFGTWVIASDITTHHISDNILNLISDAPRSAFLINSRGKVISGPCLSADNTTCNEIFGTKNVFDNSNQDLVKIGTKMVAGMNGIEPVWIDNQETYIAYAPVTSMNWSFAISMPISQVIAPAKKTEIEILSATRNASEQIDAKTNRILDIFVGLFCILLFIVILLSFLLARIITRPVEKLRLGTVAIGKGDLNYHLDIDTGDEFEVLADSFNSMTTDLKKNIEDLRHTTAEKERYAKEMEIAKEIQDTFIPEFIPAISGIELAAITLPAMEIGGDLYDFIPLDGDRWGLAIADVSGKGVSAALFMALCRTLIRVSGSAEADPSIALRRANQLIYEDGRSSMFITVFYSVLDPAKKTFTYVNAGHNPPLLVRRDSPAIQILDHGRCIALGVIPDVDCVHGELDLAPGDLIVMYTDGVTEAFNIQNKEFGEERLADYVQNHRDDPVQKILDGLIEEIRMFSGSAPQSDDITLVVMRVQ